MSNKPIRVTVWGENMHEKTHDEVKKLYPNGMHTVIADSIRERLGSNVEVRTATLDQPEHGLTDEVLENTDVITWWGHMGHHLVSDEVAAKVVNRVLSGMGLVVLHSGHWSKPFTHLMGTTCALRYREADDREVIWTVNPGHPVAKGLPEAFIIPLSEVYAEYFDIPQPEEQVFISSYSGGEVFRSGCSWVRGMGRIFLFSPGHETYPIYYQPEVRQARA